MFHITAKGTPGPCKATERACPLGGEQKHFDSQQEALGYLEREGSLLHRSAPALPRDKVQPGYLSNFKLESTATLESKNKGEFCELYVPMQLLTSDEAPQFSPGSTPWIPEKLRIGVNDYERVSPDDDEWLVETPNGAVNKLMISMYTSPREVFNDIAAAETRKMTKSRKGEESKGNSYASSNNIQQAAVHMGFTDGRVPKAPAHVKPDLIIWDTAGVQHRVSIKSYMSGTAGATAIVNASKASSVDYSAPLPAGMSTADAEALAQELNNTNSADAVKALRARGVAFTVEDSSTFSPELASNLAAIDPDAERAYKTKLLGSADRVTSLAPEDEGAYRKTLTAFATRMTPTKLSPQSEAITDFATVHADGNIIYTNFSTPEKLEQYIYDRSDLGTGGAAGVSVKDGKFILNLVGQAALTMNKKMTR